MSHSWKPIRVRQRANTVIDVITEDRRKTADVENEKLSFPDPESRTSLSFVIFCEGEKGRGKEREKLLQLVSSVIRVVARTQRRSVRIHTTRIPISDIHLSLRKGDFAIDGDAIVPVAIIPWDHLVTKCHRVYTGP